MIRHTVAFTLKHPRGSDEEQSFLKAALILKQIPGVERFEQMHQTSPKNDLQFGFSMEFADQAAYDAYNIHQHHVDFVRDRWIPEVTAFKEADFVLIKG